MWLTLLLVQAFFMVQAAGALPTPPATPPGALDYEVFKAKVEPLLLEKRPGHARCSVCHSTGTAFRLQPLSPGTAMWTDDQSRKNFDMVKRFVLPGVPLKSRLLTMPLAAEAGGVAFHPGGKHWTSQDDPEWRTLADWVEGKH
jgi:hypothetical protein